MTTHFNKAVAIATIIASLASATPVAFAQVSLHGSVNADTTVGNIVSGAASASVQSNAHASTSLGQTVSGIVSGGNNKQAAMDIDAQITKDLRISDSNIDKVSSDDTSVTVAYKVPGRFFGIFPVRTTAYVTTNASGTTKVHYPWYTFATSVNDDSLKARLEASNWAVTSSNKVQVATSIQTAMKAWVNTASTTSAQASTNASASASTK